MSKTIWRFKLMENETDNERVPLKWIDCNEYDELNQISLVIDGKETLDSHLEICAVGNEIKFKSEQEIYKIKKVISQNGLYETHIDVTSFKV
ncbi:hypothetical protein [Aquimarina sp. RZ0]|uniref:hypothetical protein n=1 Tax=Aquimarina sp. RZ0 TaxID=2607730 RepID=UPI0011F3AE01|nr:hypothetical protein [Aquimarina sp. RZ0]KAA1244552.1 hypothetical protein F0000_16330 [Aquimarina sp. RZ0]